MTTEAIPTPLAADLRRALALVRPRRRFAIVSAMLLISLVDLVGLGMLLPFMLIIATPGIDPIANVPVLHGIGVLLEALQLPRDLPVFLLFFGGIIVLKGALSVGLSYFVAATVARVTLRLRTELSTALLESSWDFLSHQRTGHLANLVGNEVNAAGQAFHDAASFAAMALQIVIYVTLAFLLSWQMALLALLILVVVVLFFNRVVRRRTRLDREQLEATHALASHMTDILAGVKVFRGMGRVESVLRSFRATATRTGESFARRLASSELSAEVLEPLIGILVVGWFYVSLTFAGLVITNVLIVGVLLVRVIYLYLTFYRSLHRVNEGRVHLTALLDLLDRARAERETFPGTRPCPEHFDIRVEQLGFSYGRHPVLADLSVDIPAGALLTIAGPSGVGKSTFLDLLLGLRVPQAGSITIAGLALGTEIDVQSWRRRIGYVPQDQVLLNTTVMQNLGFGEPDVSEADAIAALELADAWEFVRHLPAGLHSLVGERGNFLSGGQRQRIAIARALVRRPSLLVLDEATTALDPETERRIIANIDRVRGERGMTVISVSHQPAWRAAADRQVDFGAPAEAVA